MWQYIGIAIVALTAVYTFQTYAALMKNIAAAKASGLPYIVSPIYTFNPIWLLFHTLILRPVNFLLPTKYRPVFFDYLTPDFTWRKKFEPFEKFGYDLYLIVAPGKSQLLVASPEAISQITTRRNDFPKPIELYGGVDIFGKNVVSTEGSIWRHHRKITSPPFTEKNNKMVWLESLQQAQSMMAGWIGPNEKTSQALTDVSEGAMRLSLHVISRAGFGVGLLWPHEETTTVVPKGHTLTYKDALSNLLHNLLVVLLTPRWLLPILPFKMHKVANEALVEWGKYMREMYEAKRAEVKSGAARDDRMDLMGALVKGAGITQETIDSEKQSQKPAQLLTDDEILGNAFVFILAGHETAANTIHFSCLLLAMHPQSQRRLQKDLDEILGDRPVDQWDYEEDLPKLFGSMCGAVMNEELRLIPPVTGIPKSTSKDSPQGLTIAGKHHVIPENVLITLNTAALHRNPAYWPHTSAEDLDDFRPERWLLDPSKKVVQDNNDAYETEAGLDFDGPDKRPDTAAELFRPVKGSYIPFSEGYRSCLGRRFAQVEILAVLAVIFKTYSVELDVGQYLPDDDFEHASQSEKETAWHKANDRAKMLLKDHMMTIITIQLRNEKPPMRFVRRGNERMPFMK
ncbi:hypothetical protein AMS68_005151 [Peltaster fructicola]|uniref:Cytochrome P450 n=1 Tax=Peltaster fructicola TaxID=286661 RepID=A0A6H0XY24_9PEZI|nr:hypothetical protein AMS68_005151 [Peltaster fructicola]